MRSNKVSALRLVPSLMGLSLSILAKCEDENREVIMYVPEGQKQTTFRIETIDKQGKSNTGPQAHDEAVKAIIADCVKAMPEAARIRTSVDGLVVTQGTKAEKVKAAPARDEEPVGDNDDEGGTRRNKRR